MARQSSRILYFLDYLLASRLSLTLNSESEEDQSAQFASVTKIPKRIDYRVMNAHQCRAGLQLEQAPCSLIRQRKVYPVSMPNFSRVFYPTFPLFPEFSSRMLYTL